MMLAALGIYLELSHPGLILPGVVGGICGILAMMSFQMLPITAAGVVLVIIGFILIGLEFFVTAHGVLGGGGTVALILGGIFLVDPSKTDISVSYSMLFSVGLVFGAIVVAIAYFILKVRRRPAQTGYEGMLGLKAKVVAYDKKKSEGRLMIRGELWHFVTNEKNQDIKMDDMVVIRKLDGMTMIVDKE
jgi:membrane-bound serine protease (ClpP class)